MPYVSGRRYGTLRSEIERIADDDWVCVLELELEGALKVQDEVPRSVTIFIAADVDELERRLRERATESTGEIGERIALAREQLERAHEFRYMVRNDDSSGRRPLSRRSWSASSTSRRSELDTHSAREAGAFRGLRDRNSALADFQVLPELQVPWRVHDLSTTR